MNREQLQAFTMLPVAETCLIDSTMDVGRVPACWLGMPTINFRCTV